MFFLYGSARGNFGGLGWSLARLVDAGATRCRGDYKVAVANPTREAAMELERSSLSLSAGDLDRCQAVLAALLSAASFPAEGTWADRVLAALADLFGSDRSFLLVPAAPGQGGGPRLFSPNLEPACMASLRGFGQETATGGHADAAHAMAMGRLAAGGVQVFNPHRAERLTRIRFRDMPRFYPEIMVGWKVRHFGTVALWLAEGPVLLSCLSTDSQPARLAEDELTVLTLLLPALEAGIWMMRSLHERGGAIGALLDEWETPALLREEGGRSYRNRSLCDLLQTVRDPERLAAAMSGLAAELLRIGRPTRKSAPACELPTGTQTVGTAGRPLRLHGSWLRPGTVGPGPAALVVAGGAAACGLPDARALSHRYGLTPRQSHVARLLALGASNDEIAARLGISRHTARHHAQSVLERIGTRSRKAVALRFLEDGPMPALQNPPPTAV
jgi:DNA-binding CsgD family transcriptional regulator